MQVSDSEPDAWLTLSRKRILDARPWLEVWREAVELPGGRQVDDYHVVEAPDFSVVVALTNDGRLVAERHYRHGARRTVIDLPAGRIESEEEPLAAAKRELLEETGYGGGDWRFLGAFALGVSRIRVHAHMFLARNLKLLAEPESDDLEDTEILLLTRAEFLRAIANGEVADVCGAAAFLLADVVATEQDKQDTEG